MNNVHPMTERLFGKRPPSSSASATISVSAIRRAQRERGLHARMKRRMRGNEKVFLHAIGCIRICQRGTIMNPYRNRISRLARRASVLALLMFGLAACGEGPNQPRPPQSPPRPTMMSEGHLIHADLILSERPQAARPGMM